jgi:signal transduction histidine kinase
MSKALSFLCGGLCLGGLYLSSLHSYLLFHSLAEIFAVVIACGIFMVAWNARAFLKNQYLLLIGVAYFFVGVLDLVHTLAYSGMPVFSKGGANLPTELWIAARYLESLALLVAPLVLGRQLRAEFLFMTGAVLTALILLSIFAWPVFPNCYIEGVGITPFKRVSEYVICALLLVAGWLLLSKRQAFDPRVLRWLMWSIAATIGSELAFTFYVDVYDFSNLVGHFLKIIAFYLVYKAIIVTGMTEPYALLLREVNEAREQLVRVNANLEDQVRQRTASLQETTDQLNSFVHTIAHDLRAPLRSQVAFAHLLTGEFGAALGPVGLDYARRILQAAERQGQLLTDLLNYVELSRADPPVVPVELDRTVGQARALLEPEIQKRAALVEVDGARARVMANPASLRLTIHQLLSNALKFVPEGVQPRVRCRFELNGEFARVWVEDNGIGIDPQHFDKVFGVFQRLHPAGQFPGTGMGLALVKKAVERMGGRVGVESTPGRGSRFWVELRRFQDLSST